MSQSSDAAAAPNGRVLAMQQLKLALVALAALVWGAPRARPAATAAGAWYESAALTWPIVTKSATSGISYLLGELLALRLVRRPQTTPRGRRLVRGRLVRSTVAGLVSHGPQLHYWNVVLEKYVSFGGAWWAVPTKIALDQTIFSLYLNGAYCALLELMKGNSLAQAWRKVRAAAWPSLYWSWRFWPAVHAATYSVVPVHLRVLWVDAVEIVWVAILSTAISRSGKKEKETGVEAAAAASAAAAAPHASAAVTEHHAAVIAEEEATEEEGPAVALAGV